ncbi:hypothetical protein BGX38DRAFT_1149896 [Terfezia claveryi]|nr:hypothetical protein BGX38DRAFT_1239159 [Terfezia claveryi]KAF8459616.1 hypothetical protein BGX38DRAFT_1149896 [Terfezia claveryi]
MLVGHCLVWLGDLAHTLDDRVSIFTLHPILVGAMRLDLFPSFPLLATNANIHNARTVSLLESYHCLYTVCVCCISIQGSLCIHMYLKGKDTFYFL